MSREQAEARVRAQDEKLAKLEAELGRLAKSHGNAIAGLILGELVEMVCGMESPNFRVLRKIQLYERVADKLRASGIQ